MKLTIAKNDALILVDIQNDFCTGSLAVPDALSIIEKANIYIALVKKNDRPVFATRDWHPKNHSSFKDFGGIWPVHCVQNTFGSMFYKELKLPDNAIIISKATNPDKDAYSGFDGTDLDNKLKNLKIRRLFVGGLATDYCVKATVLDALSLDYTVFFLSDASKAVNIKPDDEKKSINKMLRAGAILINLNNITQSLK
ncbi:Nicotinamidase [Desulfurella amilsii]|uniref:nicotinamidase n=1 Tax=Desulfurella amilsii TaxID=1562698 RepID=A0A1X4XVH7_9BACT|nr:nicotinamidase [Desulfurella amilsii]OSS41539.1 Nicotinamidase [Desulfurella amilsii]